MNTEPKENSTPTSAKLSTYEDCLAAVTKAKAGDAAAKDAALDAIAAFFEKRIGAKKLKDDNDGVGRVKEAYERNRSFKPYEAPKPAETGNIPGGSLFGPKS